VKTQGVPPSHLFPNKKSIYLLNILSTSLPFREKGFRTKPILKEKENEYNRSKGR
jgi:hypothetical protein